MVRKEAKKVVLKDAEGNYIVPVIDPADKGGLNNYISSCKLNNQGLADLLAYGTKYMKYDVDIIGTLNKNKATLSGFGNTNYVDLKFGSSIDFTKPWTILLDVTTGVNSSQRILGGNTSFKYIGLNINDTKHFQLYLSSDGVSWNLNNGTTYPAVDAIEDNTHYFIRLSWDGTKYLLETTTDTIITSSSVWNTYITIESTEPCICTEDLIFGKGILSEPPILPFAGSLKLDTSDVLSEGVSIWHGVSETTLEFQDYTLADDTVLSFNVTSTDRLEYVALDNKTVGISKMNAVHIDSINLGNFTYNILATSDGGNIICLNLTRSEFTPSNPYVGDYWLDISKPENKYMKYTSEGWEEDTRRICYIGSFTIKDNKIISVTQPDLGRNYYNALEKTVDDKIEEYTVQRNYIRSCALDGDGHVDLLHQAGATTIAEQVGIVLGTDTNESAYVVNGQFNISGDGENTQNYDQTYTLKTPLTLTTSVQVTLHQWASHRAGSNIYAYAIFDDGTSQQVGFLTGGGDTNQTQTFTIQVEQKTLTGIRITAYSSAWSNGYAGRGANTAGIFVTHYVATSAGIVLNVSKDKPLVYVSSNGRIETTTNSTGLDFSTYSNGTYHIFTSSSGVTSATLNYTISATTPSNTSLNSYWLDVSSVPTQLKKYNGTSWQISQDCYVGSVTVSSKVISNVAQPTIKSPVSPATVIETYKNGASWYRIWSDGWIEQGGFNGSATGRNISYPITLLKSFSNTNYNIMVTARQPGEIGSAKAWGVDSGAAILTNRFSIIANAYGDPGTGGVYWRTCGY